MPNLQDSPEWSDGIYQLTEETPVLGKQENIPGDGPANIQAIQLANRTRWLRVQLESAIDYREYTFYKTESDPDGTLAGITNTPDGKMFRVAQGTESEDSFIYYLNANGVAYPVAAYVGKGYVDNRLVPGPYRSSYIPLFHDFNGMVPMWLDEGRPDAAGFGPNLRGEVAAIPNQWAQQYLAQMNFSTRYFPLFHDQNGNVPMWCVNGVPDMPAVGPDLQRFILQLVGNASGGTASADKYFIQGDLFKFIFKRGRMFSGDSVSLNFAFTGDSWTEKNTIPQSLLNVLGGAFKDPGWISCSARTDAVMAGISRAVVSGFSTYDGGSNNINKPPYGSGPDGNAYYNNNAVGTITWTGITATELSVWYYDGNGVFTITVDDNEPVTITGGGTNASKRYDFSGMSATAHKVVIASTGVGVVCIHGMYGKNSANARGITVSRMGNGGAIASDYTNFNEWIAPVASYIDLDMLFIVIGTNDFRLSKGLVQYKTGIETIISAYKSATPGICICLVSPGRCNATGTPALEEYDKAMREIAIEHNVNLISGYQLFPKTYDNSGGAWEDTLHLSSKGAYILTRTMKDKFFQE